MDNARNIVHVGAFTVALGMGNVRRTATRMAVSIGVAAVVATATVAPVASASSSDVSPADKTALIMGGTGIPTPNDYLVQVVRNQYIERTHPGQVSDYEAVTTPEEFWPVTGFFRLVALGLAAVDPQHVSPDLLAAFFPDEPWWKLSGLFELTVDQSIQAGVADLESAMVNHGNDDLVIYGYSQGANVANREKQRLADQYPAGTAAPDISFVLGGDGNLPNGGILARFPGLYLPILDMSFNGPEPTDTQFHTTVITRQYDGWADFPLYPLNLVADLNEVLGFFFVHAYPFNVSLTDDPSTYDLVKHSDTDYYFFKNENLPLFAPLRLLGVPEPVIDVVEPFVREIVELGYDRSIPPWEPTPARLIPTPDPVKVTTDLVAAVGEGITNAAALVGLPPPLKTAAPVVFSAPATEAVQTDVAQHVTSKDPPTRTAELGSVEPATENEQAANVPSTATSEQVKQTSRRATPRPVVRDSLDATERPRAFPHRRNDSATATTETTAAEPATTPDPTPASSTPAASDADNPSSDDTSGSDADDAA